MIKSSEYKVARHPSGKRLIIGDNTRLFTTPGKLANALQVGETSAREIISGKARKGWHVETMQRRRECMRISYTLTAAGRKEASTQRVKERKSLPPIVIPLSAFQVFLKHIEKGEASDISEAMLAAGFTAWDRQRVLIEGVKACKLGFAVQKKESGAIFGNF